MALVSYLVRAQPLPEEDSELIECGLPSICVCHCELHSILDSQVDQLGCGLVVWKGASGLDGLSDRHVQALDRIRGVDNPADVLVEGEEGDDLLPVPPPGLPDRRIAVVPASLELGEPGLGGVCGLGAIDVLEVRGHDVAILVGAEVQRIAGEMEDAGLDDGLREDRVDCLRKALQPVDDDDQDVGQASVPELVHHLEPELGALLVLVPDTEHVAAAVACDGGRGVDRFVAGDPLVADLDPERIEDDDRIDAFQGPVLPGADFLENGVGDPADQVRRDIDAAELLQMATDLQHTHAAGVHRDHLVVEAVDPGLAFADDPGVERGIAIPRRGDIQISLSSLFSRLVKWPRGRPDRSFRIPGDRSARRQAPS